MLGKMLDQLGEKKKETAPFQTLERGWLLDDEVIGPFEMSKRLVLAALESPNWDSGNGETRKGEINDFVRQLVDQGKIYREYDELFAAHGLHLELSKVSRVRIDRIASLPFSVLENGKKPNPEALVPFDCMVSYSVKKR